MVWLLIMNGPLGLLPPLTVISDGGPGMRLRWSVVTVSSVCSAGLFFFFFFFFLAWLVVTLVSTDAMLADVTAWAT